MQSGGNKQAQGAGVCRDSTVISYNSLHHKENDACKDLEVKISCTDQKPKKYSVWPEFRENASEVTKTKTRNVSNDLWVTLYIR